MIKKPRPSGVTFIILEKENFSHEKVTKLKLICLQKM